MNINTTKLYENFKDTNNNNKKDISNFGITSCNVFDSNENIKNNTGFYLLLFILVIFIIVFIIFYIKGKNLLEAKIDEIIYNKFTKKNKNENKNNNKNIIKENNKSKILHQSNKNYKRNHRKKLNNKKKLNSTKYNTQNEFISIEQNNKNDLNLKNREE